MKDEVLDALAERANVAQFVSFGADPALPLRHARLAGGGSERPVDAEAAVEALLARAVAGTVNVRAFHPHEPKGHGFHYGLSTVSDVIALARKLATGGLVTIVNETIPIDDGGVSGVVLGGVMEFAPDDTPRCVEKPGAVALSSTDGSGLLQRVYGFVPELDARPDRRVEFSVHPQRVGYRHTHTIVWEIEEVPPVEVEAQLVWPNRFSRMLGDKVFGLLIADLAGAPVPRTTVVGRRVAPFTFGQPTGTHEFWLRTAPREPVPGHYSTFRSWRDPFRLLEEEDRDGEVAAVIAQEGVEARYSGAAQPASDGDYLIEGVPGEGDQFMLGRRAPAALPDEVVSAVRDRARALAALLGPVRVEWVRDNERVWVVQLQLAEPARERGVIYPGEPREWRFFDPSQGLEALRGLLTTVDPRNEGIIITGPVGVTSHVGDLLRRARIPARVVSSPQS